MQCAHDGEQQQRSCSEIACKEDGEGGIAHHQYCLAGEGINEIAAERTEQQCRDGVSRQHQSYHVLCGPESLTQVERQQWR